MPLKKISSLLLCLLGLTVLSVLICLSYTYPLTLGKTSILYSDYGKFYHSQRMLIQRKNIYKGKNLLVLTGGVILKGDGNMFYHGI